jgi:hypothetical protein
VSSTATAADRVPVLMLMLWFPAGCTHGYQWPDQGQGWDIAAMNDGNPEYRGSCGVCYEIKCDNSHVRDGYGEGGQAAATLSTASW